MAVFLWFSRIYMPKQEKSVYHEELINYLCNPFDNRTYDQFAESVGVTGTTIYRYRRAHESEIAEEVKKRKDSMFDSMRSVAYKALAGKIKSDTMALKLFFQLAGDLIERSEVSTKDVMTRDQKIEKVKALMNELGSRHLLPSKSNVNGPTSDLQQEKVSEQPKPVSDGSTGI